MSDPWLSMVSFARTPRGASVCRASAFFTADIESSFNIPVRRETRPNDHFTNFDNLEIAGQFKVGVGVKGIALAVATSRHGRATVHKPHQELPISTKENDELGLEPHFDGVLPSRNASPRG
jgi:hypothetical protein